MSSNFAYSSAPAWGQPSEPPVEAEAPEPAPKSTVQQMLVPAAGLLALIVTVAALGWGFTQWSSAKQWKHRSQAMESQFDGLSARTQKAETAALGAERTAATTRAKLVKQENTNAQLANKLAFTADMRLALCDSGLLDSASRGRLCG